MGRRPSIARPVVARALAFFAGASIVLGCVGRAQGFAAWSAAWRANVTDRTGAVASIQVLDLAGPGPGLASDAVRLRNVDPQTIEVAWLGGRCVTAARFSLAPEANGVIGLRYEIGGPCDPTELAGYALAIHFVRMVDATTIDAVPEWGP